MARKSKATKIFRGGEPVDDKSWKDEQAEELAQLVKKDSIRAITKNQDIYIKAIENSTITFVSGPAGSGKSYIACGMAARLFKENKIDKIILTRPLVTCGKGLGFLPGELEEKVGPYMRPLFDAFGDFFTQQEIERMSREGYIEICPLELMRGTSLKKAFILLDEAQNCEFAQLHMFLTRFGEGSKVVITGDATQSDLINNINPFAEIMSRFGKNPHKDISVVELDRKDIVRHPLIRYIEEVLTEQFDCDKIESGAWYDITCPSCQKINWYNNGDESDITGCDIDSIQCWQCKAWMDHQGRLLKSSKGCFDYGHRKPE